MTANPDFKGTLRHNALQYTVTMECCTLNTHYRIVSYRIVLGSYVLLNCENSNDLEALIVSTIFQRYGLSRGVAIAIAELLLNLQQY